MTREDREFAKSRIEYLLKISSFVFDERDKEALDMAIQTLSQEPTEKPMTVDEMEREYEKSKALFHKIIECDDAIIRDDDEQLQKYTRKWHDIYMQGWNDGRKDILRKMEMEITI